MGSYYGEKGNLLLKENDLVKGAHVFKHSHERCMVGAFDILFIKY